MNKMLVTGISLLSSATLFFAGRWVDKVDTSVAECATTKVQIESVEKNIPIIRSEIKEVKDDMKEIQKDIKEILRHERAR